MTSALAAPATDAPAPRAAAAVTDARTQALLEGPIASTLLRLAAPGVAVMLLQAGVGTMDGVFVGWLGAEALAGVSLVYPLLMLMQTMSAGGMGGGIASAVARALGGGRREDADRLAAHGLLIALAMGALFTVTLLAGGPAVYRALGGHGAALDAALAYSRVLFGGAAVFWLFNSLASVIRGTGRMLLPAGVMAGASVLYLLLSPALVMGWGPLPRLGVAGAATASVAAFGAGTLVLAAHLLSAGSLVRLRPAGFRPRAALFGEILRVGAPGALNTVFTNLTVVLLTGLVGTFGMHALAGYGMGARLEYIQIPIVFGVGSALVAMVGTNVGAGRIARAERVAWVGAGLAGGITTAIGLTFAVFPHAWLGLFTTEPAVLETGTAYLRIVGPFYGFFGVGLALYFASQGAGRLAWPLLAGFLRLVVAATGGWLATRWLGGGPSSVFVAIAVALVVMGVMVVIPIKAGAWRRGREESR
jgi:putative MATE family efflux protein